MINNFKPNEHVGDHFKSLEFQITTQPYNTVPGEMSQREFIGQVLQHKVSVRAGHYIVFEGSFLDLAMLFIRDLAALGAGMPLPPIGLDPTRTHPFAGILEGTPDRPCTLCHKADRHPIHKRPYNQELAGAD